MELKDTLTVAIASAALITSISTVILNYRLENTRQSAERRKRFSEAVVGLSSVRKDFEDARKELGQEYFSEKYEGLRMQIADARSFYISTLQELYNIDHSIGSDFEHLVLAANLIDRGRIADARQHFRLATTRSRDPYTHAVGLRVYGRSIFQGGEFSQGILVMLEAAREFEKLVNSVDFEHDAMIAETLDTLRRTANALNSIDRGRRAIVVVRAMIKLKDRMKFKYNRSREELASKALYEWERKLTERETQAGPAEPMPSSPVEGAQQSPQAVSDPTGK